MFSSIFHSALPPYIIGTVALGKRVIVRLRALAEVPITKIFLRSTPEGEEVFVPLVRLADEGGLQWWQVQVDLTVPVFDYRFWVFVGKENFWVSATGCTRYTPLDCDNFKLVCMHQPPEWVPEAVFYQIFPDRFCNGDDSLSVKTGEYCVDGREVVSCAWEASDLPKGSHVFCGGDIPGIISKLDYLQELGVTALYLNPIFTAPSNHKYDVADYYHVDPHLGGDVALEELRQELSRRKMRLILDIVPNHCGITNVWFKAAQSDIHAPEADFFTFRHYPDDYDCWLGVGTLPRLNYASPQLRERMYAGSHAIMRSWLRHPYSIDGWRIDVANMLGRRGRHQLDHKVGRAIRQAVKSENEQAWILGEHFFDGTSHLQGDELDASMNYRGFMAPVLQWLCGRNRCAYLEELRGEEIVGADSSYLPTEAFIEQLNQFRTAVPERIALGQMNMLDSHDTPRFLTMARGDVERMKVAITLLFTYQGVPCVYYGDEVGMEGGVDPDCRRPMEWHSENWNANIRNHYCKLISLRRNSSALQKGCLQMLQHPYGVVFMREDEKERWLIALNRGRLADEEALPACPYVDVRPAGIADGTCWRDSLSGEEAVVKDGKLPLVPNGLGSAVWREVEGLVDAVIGESALVALSVL